MKNKDIERDFLIENLKLGNIKEQGDCHINSKFIAEKLKKLGYKIKVITGIYSNPPKNRKHSWIEFEDKILETDCKQLRELGDIMPNEFCAVLDKTKFKHRYKELTL